MYSQIASNRRSTVFLFVSFIILILLIGYVLNLVFAGGLMFIIIAAIMKIPKIIGIILQEGHDDFLEDGIENRG